MPIHDWTKVDAGIFHHFHHEWISEIARALNRGLLPTEFYALLVLHAEKAKAVVIHHVSNHKVIAMVEIVSPGNKNNRHGFRSFVQKAIECLRSGIHLLIIDLFPPGPRDPQGIHKPIWDEFMEEDFTLPPDRPLSLGSYVGCPGPEAFLEPTSVGALMVNMPLFLIHEGHISVPLEATYQAAWAAVPAYWQGVLESTAGS